MGALGHQHQPPGAFAHLADAARRRAHPFQVDGLDGVDHRQHRTQLLQLLHDRLQVVLSQHQEAVAGDVQPLRPQLELLHRFLARNVDHRAEGAGDLVGQLQQERGLADPRVAADQDEGAGDYAPAQDLVQLAHP